ncbi:MAG: tRNA threonylcarbamoyladenosine dehydratase [Deltaproteobacteria bacterium]|nr:MAG: tRNA threonylcarbamoyladenosine dehydratase [Deltaproteobacteria bacterium]
MPFSGTARLVGVEGLQSLRRAHVAVVGVGGVGSWTAEALARCGVGRITLMDLDDVCITNTNRQVHAMPATVGRTKVSVMAERIRAIAPDCRVGELEEFLGEDTLEELFLAFPDVIVDAIDDVAEKCRLVAAGRQRGVPVVVSGGAGGRRDPAQVRTGDLQATGGDGMLRDVRRTLRRVHGWPQTDAPWGVPAVWSTERPVWPQPDGTVCATPPTGARGRLDCRTGFGTAVWVTGTFGFAAAQLAVEALLR